MRAKRPIYADTYTRRRCLLWTVVIVVLLIAGVSGAWWWRHKNPRPNPRRYPVMGVRVDQSVGAVDAADLKAGGVDFVYLKATQGASFVDDNFATNYSRVAGLTIGVYHYFSFDSTPQAQAANFIRHVHTQIGTLPIGIYLTYYGRYASTPPQAMRQKVQALVTLLQQHYRCAVVLMGSPKVLARVKNVAPTSPRWVISPKRPASGQFWEYATAKLPRGSADQAYTSAVFTGTKAAFAKLQ